MQVTPSLHPFAFFSAFLPASYSLSNNNGENDHHQRTLRASCYAQGGEKERGTDRGRVRREGGCCVSGSGEWAKKVAWGREESEKERERERAEGDQLLYFSDAVKAVTPGWVGGPGGGHEFREIDNLSREDRKAT